MRITTVREFRNRTTRLLRSKTPVLVTRQGRVAGVFFPCPESSFPLELKRELFAVLAAQVSREAKKRGLTEDWVQGDFKAWREKRRETRRRR
jgi:hypothetical protein